MLHLRLLQGSWVTRDAVMLDTYTDAITGLQLVKAQVVMAVVTPKTTHSWVVVVLNDGSTCTVPSPLVLVAESARPNALRVLRLTAHDTTTAVDVAEVRGCDYLRVVSCNPAISMGRNQVYRGDRLLFANGIHLKLATCTRLKELAASAPAGTVTVILERGTLKEKLVPVVRKLSLAGACAGEVEDVAVLPPHSHPGSPLVGGRGSSEGSDGVGGETFDLLLDFEETNTVSTNQGTSIDNVLGGGGGDGNDDDDSTNASRDSTASPWVQFMSKSKGKFYYYNTTTKAKTWIKPAQFGQLPNQPEQAAPTPASAEESASVATGTTSPQTSHAPETQAEQSTRKRLPDIQQKVLVAAVLMDSVVVGGDNAPLSELAVFAVTSYQHGAMSSLLLALPIWNAAETANSAQTATYRSSPLPRCVRGLAPEPNTSTLFVLLDHSTSKTPASSMCINRWIRVRKRTAKRGSSDPGFLMYDKEFVVAESRVQSMSVVKPDGPHEPVSWLIVLLDTGCALVLDTTTLGVRARVAAPRCTHIIGAGWQLFMAGSEDSILRVASLKSTLQRASAQGALDYSDEHLVAAAMTEDLLKETTRCQDFDLQPHFMMTTANADASLFVPMSLLEQNGGRVWGLESPQAVTKISTASFSIQFPEPVVVGCVVVKLLGQEGAGLDSVSVQHNLVLRLTGTPTASTSETVYAAASCSVPTGTDTELPVNLCSAPLSETPCKHLRLELHVLPRPDDGSPLEWPVRQFRVDVMCRKPNQPLEIKSQTLLRSHTFQARMIEHVLGAEAFNPPLCCSILDLALWIAKHANPDEAWGAPAATMLRVLEDTNLATYFNRLLVLGGREVSARACKLLIQCADVSVSFWRKIVAFLPEFIRTAPAFPHSHGLTELFSFVQKIVQHRFAAAEEDLLKAIYTAVIETLAELATLGNVQPADSCLHDLRITYGACVP